MEERFGCESHLRGDRVCGAGTGPSRRTSNIQHPTFKPEHLFTAEKPQQSDLDKLA